MTINGVNQLDIYNKKENAKQLAKSAVKLAKLQKEVETLQEKVNFLSENIMMESAQLFLRRKIFRLEDSLKRAEQDLLIFNEFAKLEDHPFTNLVFGDDPFKI